MSSRTAIDPPSYEQAVGSAKTTVEIGCNSLPQVQSTSTSSSLLPKPSQLAQRRTEEMVRSQLQQLAETRFLREQNSRSNPCPPSYEESARDNVVETGVQRNLLLSFQSTQQTPSLLPKPSSMAQRRTEEMVRNQLQQLTEIQNLNT